MQKVRPWCGPHSDQGRLKTEYHVIQTKLPAVAPHCKSHYFKTANMKILSTHSVHRS